MGLIGDWWNRLLGRKDEPPRAPPPPASRPIRPEVPSARSGDELDVQPAGQAPAKPRRNGAGFDPYGNDAGFAKPHGWEHLDRD